MKTRFLKLSMIIALAVVFTNCKSDKTPEVTTDEAKEAATSVSGSAKYLVDTAESSIHWKGSKPTGTHTGTINLEKGYVEINDGVIKSGTFLIDMNSINVTDLESGDGKENLESHLKGTVEGKEDHFFNVNKYPSAAFTITGSAMSDDLNKLEGNLTIRDQKHNISFPINITNENEMLTIESNSFTINRTKWGINYGSKSIFDDLGDKFINDNIEIKIILKAKKA